MLSCRRLCTLVSSARTEVALLAAMLDGALSELLVKTHIPDQGFSLGGTWLLSFTENGDGDRLRRLDYVGRARDAASAL